MRYLLTGHTGFKGSWLALLLDSRGHEVCGLALDPPERGLYHMADVGSVMRCDIRADVREPGVVVEALSACEPDVVVHLAAQPLVRESLRDPRTTIETNVTGTLNVLEAVHGSASVLAHVVVTTDKVYRNVNQIWGYREHDALGGDDPYSASKAMAELLVHAWSASFGGCPTATARAGNVIGGGDVSAERLMPDLLAAYADGRAPVIRYPSAVRPWQHVLDALDGYLTLVDALLAGQGAGAWNFGPDSSSFVTVAEVADRVATLFDAPMPWVHDADAHPEEAGLLALDATRAEVLLGWRGRLQLQESLQWTVDWARRVRAHEPAGAVTRSQIAAYDLLGRAHRDASPHVPRG